MRRPTISVIIPTFNRASLVSEALESVLKQEVPPVLSTRSRAADTDVDGRNRSWMEIVVVDDASTDETAHRVSAFAQRDSRVRLLQLDRHSGNPGYVRNRGVERSSGEFVAFLDSDDYWLPGKLARQLSVHVEHPEIRISHTRERWIRSGKEVSQTSQTHRRRGDMFGDSLHKCVIGPSTVVVARRLFEETGGFREDLEVAEDYEYWLRITVSEPVEYVDEPLIVKRAGHGDQLSERYGRIEDFRIAALRPLVDRGYFSAVRPRDLGSLTHLWNVGSPGDQVEYRDPAPNRPVWDGLKWVDRPGPPEVLARRELARKMRVYANGARKRGRLKEAKEYVASAKLYDF